MEAQTEVQERMVGPMVVAGIRMKGKYSECGKAFGTLGRKVGRFMAGKPMLLHYDSEYKEEDADFEACFPLKAPKPVEGAEVRELAGGRCVTLVHKGPYEQLGQSYQKIFGYVQAHGYHVVMPTREVYVKGPRMLFRRNPKNYVTEIQVVVQETGD